MHNEGVRTSFWAPLKLVKATIGTPLGATKRPLRPHSVRRQNLVDLKLPELRETLAHQVVLMLITVMHLLAERQGL